MSQRVDLRSATEAHVPRLTQLYIELIEFKGPDELEAVWVNTSASTCAEVAKHDVESPDINLYVAEAGSEVVGFIKYTFEEKTWGKTCEIASLVVTEPWRSKGIGKKLMALVEQKARDAETKVASLHVLVGNEEGEGFYEGLDYIPYATHYIKPL